MAQPLWKCSQTIEKNRTDLGNGERSVHPDTDGQDEAQSRLVHCNNDLWSTQFHGPYWEDHLVPNRRSVPIRHRVWKKSGILKFSSTEPHQQLMVWDVQHQGRHWIHHWSHNTTQIPDQIYCLGIQHQVWWDFHIRTRVFQGRCQRNIFIILIPHKDRQTTQKTGDQYSELLHNRRWPHARETSDDPPSIGKVHQESSGEPPTSE